MWKQKISWKLIICSMIFTLLIFMLFAGLIIIDYNIYKIGFSNKCLPLAYKNDVLKGQYIDINFMGQTCILNFSFLFKITDNLNFVVNTLFEDFLQLIYSI